MLVVTLELIINYEREKELLSYGDQLKIVSPAHLAEKSLQDWSWH
jgi:predicted DNA-binding transcriptional regulator YafY